MKRSAFTLVELLVVIAIIGLLSTVAVVATSSARAKARDTKRLADLRQIRTAVELYYEINGSYPQYISGAVTCSGGWATPNTGYIACWNDLESKLSPYMSKLPRDPMNNYPVSNNFEGYDYNAPVDGSKFCIMAQVEMVDSDKDEGCYSAPWYCLGTCS